MEPKLLMPTSSCEQALEANKLMPTSLRSQPISRQQAQANKPAIRTTWRGMYVQVPLDGVPPGKHFVLEAIGRDSAGRPPRAVRKGKPPLQRDHELAPFRLPKQ
ncbi:hypothetical protein MJO28_012971 [Puccinia striiformis f. sp. tritici]|uniref:Uncharacterized protein n=2 Tax=Puccinia striiformis TaxID=27350 RepID=A0A2S4W5M1_9BASI|nr:hypothetical protein MJO28_012971 [Puccinia striiformis f. sp. tritici]POW17026.1 hypothetical protein PSTT_00790 [Puccinia striiformis]